MDFPIHGNTAGREAINCLPRGSEQVFGFVPSYGPPYDWPETFGLVRPSIDFRFDGNDMIRCSTSSF
jgi:hypothetical protein